MWLACYSKSGFMRLKNSIKALFIPILLLTISIDIYAQWTSVGSSGFSSGIAFNNYIAIDNTNTPYVAYRDASAGGYLTVHKYTGSNWDTVGNTKFSAGDALFPRLTFDSNDTPYVAYKDAGNSNKGTVMKFNGSNWVAVGGVGFTPGTVDIVSIAFNSNDTLYAAFGDGNNSSKATLMKYNGSSWVTVGTAGFSSGGADNICLAFDSNDTPYVAFRDLDNSFGATVMKYNGSTWVLVGNAAFSSGSTFYESLKFDSNDTPYIGFADYTNSQKATVMKFDGSNWVNVGPIGFSAGSAQSISLAIDANDVVHIAYQDFGNSGKATVMKFNGYNWTPLDSAGITAGGSGNTSLAFDNNNIPYLAYRNDNNSLKAAVLKFPINIWNGSIWSEGTPDSTSYAAIASSTAPTAFSCYDLTIGKGYTLNIGTSNTNTIYGDLYNSGNGISGTGTVHFSKDGTAQLGGNLIQLSNTITTASTCTLQTNDRLTIYADATTAGRIGNSAGIISGDVSVQCYMPGKRCFRFYGHPFISSIALSQLTEEIDITGSGGATNGFTTTVSNNPSAFWFDVTSADTSTTGNNPGWKAFTSANTNDWDRYELLRLLVRGTKGQGLTGGSYSPGAVAFKAAGPINQGTQVCTLAKGSNSEFVACGNPYPSPVQMNTVSLGSNVGANYYVWDATAGAAGAYITNPWTLSYVIPTYSAFFTTVSSNSNNTITFEEQDKDTGGAALFKGTANNDWIELIINDSSTKWDRLLINLNNNSMALQDKQDAIKLYNPGLDFYTISDDQVRLAVDVRPYTAGKSIPLGLTAYNRYNKYVIKTGIFNVPKGVKLYLHDKYLNTQQELKAGFEYWFDVNSDTASQGNNRFEINMVGTTTGISPTIQDAKIFMYPNPAHDAVKISFNNIDSLAEIRLLSTTGKTVYTKGITNTGSINISLANLPAGIYIVELKGGNVSFSQKLIVQ